MFNDERINLRIAKLYFNLVLIIFIPTSIFTLVKGLYWSRLATFGLSFFFFEISIVLSGIIILLIDLIFFRLKSNKDEHYLYRGYEYSCGIQDGKRMDWLYLMNYDIWSGRNH